MEMENIGFQALNQAEVHESDSKNQSITQAEVVTPQSIHNIKKPLLKSFCCFNLRTGCLIFGYLNIVVAVIYNIVTFILMFDDKSVFEETAEANLKDLGIDKLNEADEETVTDLKLGINIAIGISVGILVIVALLIIIVNIVLLVGTYKKKPGYLRAYVITMIAIVIIMVMGMILNISQGNYGVIDAIEIVAGLILNIVSTAVVYSHKQELLIGQLAATPADTC